MFHEPSNTKKSKIWRAKCDDVMSPLFLRMSPSCRMMPRELFISRGAFCRGKKLDFSGTLLARFFRKLKLNVSGNA